MAKQTVGQEEDERALQDAFKEALRRPPVDWYKKYARWPVPDVVARRMFEAGMLRGEEKRGCCQECDTGRER